MNVRVFCAELREHEQRLREYYSRIAMTSVHCISKPACEQI
ncbi:hypothetical protein DB30_02164 [Enhygromyxa salina]|uniref:Uncharacterized protein n=1 Tax=Enhygromyxa salina TaxID=215803 RepID=A0A0C1ZKC6_9BACT|nr:hypothetical protein DB30_02164 [Enhygromyxa salina]